MTQDRRQDCRLWNAPDLAEIERLARRALDDVPDAFRSSAREIVLRVEDFASDQTLREMAVDDPFSLTGLYDGIPLTEKSTDQQPLAPDTIWLFRRPILDEWADRVDQPLGALVAHVLIHELAHHFGWSDADIAAIDRWWE
ncbi:MAG: metallopeptidase family protein [Pseudomonadota bacterium]